MQRYLWIYLLAALGAVWLANATMKLRDNPSIAVTATTPMSSAAQPTAPRFALPVEYVEASRHGSYVTSVQVEGRDLHMLIDTGASFVSLTKEDAESIGIHPAAADFTLQLQTANGISRAAPTWLPSVRVGAIEVHDVQAIVLAQGASTTSLLGMSFLGRLHRFGVANGKMVLEQ